MSMPELPERLKPFLDRQGLVAVGHLPARDARESIVRSLPTSGHALDLFDAVVASAGERGWLDPDEQVPRRRRVHLRDADGWLNPVPLLTLAEPGAEGFVVPLVEQGGCEPAEPPPVPSGPPRLPGRRAAFAGNLTFREGAAWFRIDYDGHGLKFETSMAGGDGFTSLWLSESRPFTVDPLARPPSLHPISLLCRADLDPRGQDIGTLVEWVLAADGWSRVPARVRLPAPIPGGPMRALRGAVLGLRRALWEGRIPEAARWVVVDGYAGAALCTGATPEEALAGWTSAVWQARPKPPELEPREPGPPAFKLTPLADSPAPPADPSHRTFTSGAIEVQGPAPTIPWPPPDPALVPVVLFPLVPAPAEVPPAFARAGGWRWARLLGELGEAGHVLVRAEDDGYLLVGEHVVDVVDPASVSLQIDLARERWPFGGDEDLFAALGMGASFESFRVWNDLRRQPCAWEVASRSQNTRFRPEVLDGRTLPWLVSRVTHSVAA